MTAGPPASPPGLEYPCEFPLKLFIRPDAAVEQRLESLVRSALPDGSPVTVSRRASSSGKYLALTLVFVARDEAELNRVIRISTADPGVLLAL